MLGAVIGDIVGSRFEFDNHKSKHFELFHPDCFFTDDSVMTLALARAVMETDRGKLERDAAYYVLLRNNAVRYMRKIGRKYPSCGYGGRFYNWMFSADSKPYNSYGNGAAMRVSPAGFSAGSEGEALAMAEALTDVTHNHPEGIKGAQATALCIWLARQGASQAKIRERIERDYYSLDFTIDRIRPAYEFDESCQGTVPQAIACFLEASSFEDALRTAISLGGDCDTIAAITGAIAEAAFGIPDDFKNNALALLTPELREIAEEWSEFSSK